MSINKKSSSVVPVPRDGLGFTLTSANQDVYPIVYTDDVWSIVKEGTKISIVVGEVSAEDGGIGTFSGETGTYTLFDLIEAVSDYAVQTAVDLDLAVRSGGTIETMVNEKIGSLDARVSGSTKGFSVEIEQVDGLITRVSLEVPNLAEMYDAYGSAAVVLGTKEDGYTDHTVYGAFAAIAKANSDFNAAIEALDSTVSGEDNGVTVTVTEVNGKLTKVVVANTLLGSVTDSVDMMTLYGVKKFAKDILGTSSDDKNTHSVYGAFKYGDYILQLLNDFKASRIPDSKIRALFCTS
jgi:hypothetical protein